MTTDARAPAAPPVSWAGVDGLLALRSRLQTWVRDEPRVQAAVAFGSTERKDRPADAWSDIDMLFVVDDEAAWLDDLGWVDAIGPSWIRLVNQGPIPDMYVVQVLFAGGYDVDLIPLDRQRIAVIKAPGVHAELFGPGASVVLDRVRAFDWLTAETLAVAASSGVRPPSSETFAETVAIFLYQMVWATKRLRRGERWRAHDDIDDYMRDRLLTMLEWHALAMGVKDVYPESRKLEVWIPPQVAAELPATFAQYDDHSIAQALVTSHSLFRRLAHQVADRWGLSYPDDADAEIERWVSNRLTEAPSTTLLPADDAV